MKNYQEIDTPSPEEMKDLIASLSPSERALLADQTFITEDEADLILSDRSMNDGGKTFTMDEVIGNAQPRRPRHRRTA